MRYPDRLPRGSTLQLVFLGATVVLALWLGYQAADAVRSHERAVEAALIDYAGISAWEFARAAQSDIDEVLGDVFRPLRRRLGRGPLSPGVVGWNLHGAARAEGCACPGFDDPRLLFRIEMADGGTPDAARVVTEPDTASLATQRVLASLVLSQPMGRRNDGIVTAAAGELLPDPVAVGFYLSRNEQDEVEAAYGFVIPVTGLSQLLQEIYEDQALLPQPIARGQPNDSLLTVRVRDDASLVVWQSAPGDPAEWA
ncbi:MAG: hypothetical protein R3253_04855, partial [Longimicrobiales bacterium]|nr:hypothetical protein [Longimicrobiales bacterium]